MIAPEKSAGDRAAPVRSAADPSAPLDARAVEEMYGSGFSALMTPVRNIPIAKLKSAGEAAVGEAARSSGR